MIDRRRATAGGMAMSAIRVALSAAVPVLLFGVANAQLPSPATPGGALPQVDLGLPTVAPPPAAAFPIPPVVERPLDVEEGERLFVKRFALRGVTERPALGVSSEELFTLLENLRIDRQGLSKVDASGFTPEEQDEIAAFMQRVVTNPDQDMLFEDYQALIDRLRMERLERDAGMTVGQMQEIANAVTEYYRSAGFILAQAYVPAQEVTDGEVTIEVVEGTLDQVLVEGNEAYSSAVLARPFDDIIDAPVTAAGVESRILTLSDYPGLSVFGVFQPGEQVGSSDLVLRVQEERPYVANLRHDNHGTRFTGERRVYGDFTWNNPTGVGDRVTVAALQQYRPKNSFFGSLEYERPVLLPGMMVGASFSSNPYDVGDDLAVTGLGGRSEVAEVWVRGALQRSRQENVYGQVGLSRKTATTDIDGTPIFRDNLAVLNTELSFDSIDSESRAINFASLGADVGLGSNFGGSSRDDAFAQAVPPSRTAASGTVGSNDFWKLTGNYSRLQTMTENQTLLVRVEGQWSTSLLTSLEQFDIGGPTSVRAYPISEHLSDSGAFVSAEWTMNLPGMLGFGDAPAFAGRNWGEVLRLSVFGDWAWAQMNSPTVGQQSTAAFFGVGAGLQINFPGQFTGRLQVATPVGSGNRTDVNPSGDASDGETTHWWFDLTYTF